MRDIQALALDIHERNKRWWLKSDGTPVPLEPRKKFMLAITEFAEAVEGIRKDLMDDHLPHRKMEEVEIADAMIRLLDSAIGLKIGLNVSHFGCEWRRNFVDKTDQILHLVHLVCETADHFDTRDYYRAQRSLSLTVHGIIKYSDLHGLDLWTTIQEKLDYNDRRKDHTYEAREAIHGKKF